MTVKAHGQIDQELHPQHSCASTMSRRHGNYCRDDSIIDNVGRRGVRAEAVPKLANNSRG
jgi:hypothetical protein